MASDAVFKELKKRLSAIKSSQIVRSPRVAAINGEKRTIEAGGLIIGKELWSRHPDQMLPLPRTGHPPQTVKVSDMAFPASFGSTPTAAKDRSQVMMNLEASASVLIKDGRQPEIAEGAVKVEKADIPVGQTLLLRVPLTVSRLISARRKRKTPRGTFNTRWRRRSCPTNGRVRFFSWPSGRRLWSARRRRPLPGRARHYDGPARSHFPNRPSRPNLLRGRWNTNWRFEKSFHHGPSMQRMKTSKHRSSLHFQFIYPAGRSIGRVNPRGESGISGGSALRRRKPRIGNAQRFG